ncbi:hypothetical protein THRCLA_02745 [Thraustotheca clavata]|uniref:Uncharacterized protein n=1 Tax=Thraustotheca clavata TaxID=74557 RepID=A0A1W0A4F1_9STRA|nr:hypothetical protein THRCLA_02745 [Thraustotheca clavata]
MDDPDAYELIGSAKSRLDEVERDRMDLKMEVAHLRSRLLERVGGDTSALELEEESFMLKKELLTKERMLSEQSEYLSNLEINHQKALDNLQKLDAAWRASALKTQQLQELVDRQSKKSNSVEAMQKVLKAQDEAMTAMQQKIKELEACNNDKERSSVLLQAELEATKQKYQDQTQENQEQAQANDVVHRATMLDLEDAKEKLAHFQGQATALKSQVNHLEQANETMEKAHALLKAKVLQLTEENAATTVNASASKFDYERKIAECDSLLSDVERLTTELQTRDTKLYHAEQQIISLERLVAEMKSQQTQLKLKVTSLEQQVEEYKHKNIISEEEFDLKCTSLQQSVDDFKSKAVQWEEKYSLVFKQKEAIASEYEAKLAQSEEKQNAVQRLLTSTQQKTFAAEGSLTSLKQTIANDKSKLAQSNERIFALENQINDLKKTISDVRSKELQTKKTESELEKKWRDQVLAAEKRTRDVELQLLLEQKTTHRLLKWQKEVCTTIGVDAAEEVISRLERELEENAKLLQTANTLREKLQNNAKASPIQVTPQLRQVLPERNTFGLYLRGKENKSRSSPLVVPSDTEPGKPSTTPTNAVRPITPTAFSTLNPTSVVVTTKSTPTLIRTTKSATMPIATSKSTTTLSIKAPSLTQPKALSLKPPSTTPTSFNKTSSGTPTLSLKPPSTTPTLSIKPPSATPALSIKPPSITPALSNKPPSTTPTTLKSPLSIPPPPTKQTSPITSLKSPLTTPTIGTIKPRTPDSTNQASRSVNTLFGLKRKAGDLSMPSFSKPKFLFGKSRQPPSQAP